MVAKATCPHLLFTIVGRNGISIDAFSASPTKDENPPTKKSVELRYFHVANNCTYFIFIVLFKELLLFGKNNCQLMLTIQNKVLPLYHQTATKRFRQINKTMLLSEKLLAEIKESTNVQMFIDESANIFWVSKDGHYVWMSQDSTYNEYLDEAHIEVEQNSPEGVGNTGVYWNNEDFNNPFHITDFEERIATINI